MNQLSTLLDKQVPKDVSDVDKLIFLVRLSDRVEGMTREFLYKVFTEGSWKERFSSWSSFVVSPEGLNKSQTWGSKQLKIHKIFTLEGNIDPEELAEIPYESLYEGTFLEGEPKEKLAKLKLMSRTEIKSQKAFEDTGEEHVCFCKVCGRKLS